MQRWLAFWSSLNVHQSSASFPGELVARRPRLTLGAALVAATVALAALISPSVASAQFDFTVTTSGPQNVVQGRPLYFVVTATPVSGTSPTLIPITVAGLPAGATVAFPDIAQSCRGANQIYSLPTSTTIQINTLATTPVGSATLTVSVTAGTLTRSASFPITVTAPPSPLAQQPYAAASSVPQLALWQSNMTT